MTQVELDAITFSVTVLFVYKPPPLSAATLINALDSLIDSLLSKNVIIAGDFNIDLLEGENTLTMYMTAKGLTCGITQPTTNNRTCIDLIYTNMNCCVFGIGETYYSHHKAIWVALQ